MLGAAANVNDRTSIQRDERLEVRLVAAAKRAGMTAHAFIFHAIEQTIEQSELEEAFHRMADARWATLLESGESIPWDEASFYVAAKARGEGARRPTARRLER